MCCSVFSRKPCWELNPSFPPASSFTTLSLLSFSCPSFVLGWGLLCHHPTVSHHSPTPSRHAAVRGVELVTTTMERGGFSMPHRQGTHTSSGDRSWKWRRDILMRSKQTSPCISISLLLLLACLQLMSPCSISLKKDGSVILPCY